MYNLRQKKRNHKNQTIKCVKRKKKCVEVDNKTNGEVLKTNKKQQCRLC